MDRTIIIIGWLAGTALIIGFSVFWGIYLAKRNRAPVQNFRNMPELRELTPEEQEGLIAIWKQSSVPYVKLTPVRKPIGVYDSKLGGTPYLPPGFTYPHNADPKSNKRPLKLLCQLNFAQLPRLDGYPAKGILQFYIANEVTDDIHGLNFDNQTEQAGWRVIYHKDIITDESRLQKPPKLDSGDEVYFPLEGEFALEAKFDIQAITCSDHRWQEFMENVIEPTPLCQSLKEKYSQDEIEEALCEASNDFGFKIGGYPSFTQNDPRDYEIYKEYSALLLQLDSLDEAGIIFGDCGVANWFIKPEALKNADFSQVLYNWDCY